MSWPKRTWPQRSGSADVWASAARQIARMPARPSVTASMRVERVGRTASPVAMVVSVMKMLSAAASDVPRLSRRHASCYPPRGHVVARGLRTRLALETCLPAVVARRRGKPAARRAPRLDAQRPRVPVHGIPRLARFRNVLQVGPCLVDAPGPVRVERAEHEPARVRGPDGAVRLAADARRPRCVVDRQWARGCRRDP